MRIIQFPDFSAYLHDVICARKTPFTDTSRRHLMVRQHLSKDTLVNVYDDLVVFTRIAGTS